MATTAPLRMTPAEWGMLGALSLIWGGSFFFVGVAVKELPPFTIVLMRVGIAALILHLVLAARGERLPTDPRLWLAFLGLGLINNLLPFSFLTWGQSHIAGGLASILNATTPLFTIMVAHMLTVDDRLTPGRVTGIAVGFAGVTMMVGPDALGGLNDHLLGQLSCLGAPVCYAFGTLYARRFTQRGQSGLSLACAQFTTSAVMLVPIVAVIDAPWTLALPGPGTWAAIAALAVLSTAVAYLIYFRILRTAGATNIQLVTFLVPITAILLGALFLDEQLDTRHFAGMALIGAGLAAIDGRPFAWLRARLRLA